MTLGPLGLCSGTFIIGAATNLWPVLLQLSEFQASASRRKAMVAMVAMTISEILPTTFELASIQQQNATIQSYMM